MTLTEKVVQSSAKIGEGAGQIHKRISEEVSGVGVAGKAYAPFDCFHIDTRSMPVAFTGPLDFTVKVDSRRIVGLVTDIGTECRYQ